MNQLKRLVAGSTRPLTLSVMAMLKFVLLFSLLFSLGFSVASRAGLLPQAFDTVDNSEPQLCLNAADIPTGVARDRHAAFGMATRLEPGFESPGFKSSGFKSSGVESTMEPRFLNSLDTEQYLPASADLDPETITFLSWNIYKGAMANWQHDLHEFAGRHDVIALQEARLDNVLNDLLQDNGHSWSLHEAFRLNGNPVGVMTAAIARPVSSCGFKVNEPLIRVPKSALVSYYRLTGHEERLLVANVHSVNFSLGMQAYRSQLESLGALIAQHDGPVILAGDFNTWSQRRMQVLEALAAMHNLNDISYRHPHRTRVMGKTIDHVFYRGLELMEDHVMRVDSSDHNPISVHFSYKPAYYHASK